MDSDTMRRLTEHLHDQRRRDWNDYGTTECPAFDTTIEDDAHWSQGDRGRDAGRSEDSQG
jgi:hypothetical protein